MSASTVGVGLAQVLAEPLEPEQNRKRTVEAAAEAFAAGADIVVLPEMIVPGFVPDWRAMAPLAEPWDGPSVQAWTALAGESGGYIVGGFCERDGEALYNTAVAVGPSGVLLHYRKLHLFGEEKVAFRPGNRGLPVAATRFGMIGVCVCYDLRFPEVVRALALQGADLVCVPTAWITGFDPSVAEAVRRLWDETGMIPQAHGAVLQANLSQVFVACASQAGVRGDLRFLGTSVLADPYGERLLGPFSGTEDEIAVAQVDIGAAKRAQVRGPLIAPRADRRTDVYGIRLGDQVL